MEKGNRKRVNAGSLEAGIEAKLAIGDSRAICCRR